MGQEEKHQPNKGRNGPTGTVLTHPYIFPFVLRQEAEMEQRQISLENRQNLCCYKDKSLVTLKISLTNQKFST